MPGSRLPLSTLTELCRTLRHYLGGGLLLQQAFRHQAKKGSLRIRPIASRIAAAIDRGSSLQDALLREGDAFPPLLLALTDVGEQTGMLPEVFTALEKYFQREQKLRNKLLGQLFYAGIQFLLALAVVTGLIYVMGLLAERQGPNARPLDPLGFGLAGASGALTFLGIVLGTLAALAALYFLLTRGLRQRAAFHAFLLQLPALGPCMQSIALTRFCVALGLTTETALPIGKALQLSLRATSNPAFIEQQGRILAGINAGDDLPRTLARTGLFPTVFQEMLLVAEESGRLTEVLQHQARHYHDESGRRLTALTTLLGHAIWALVGLLIIFVIFRIATWYVGLLNV